jgi:hypothetical protein
MTSVVFVLVGAFILGIKFTADLVKTRPRKCSVFHHLGVATVVTSDESHADGD